MKLCTNINHILSSCFSVITQNWHYRTYVGKSKLISAKIVAARGIEHFWTKIINGSYMKEHESIPVGFVPTAPQQGRAATE